MVRTRVLCGLCVACVLLGAQAQTSFAQVSVKEILDGYRQQLRLAESIDVEYRNVLRPSTELRKNVAPEQVEVEQKHRFVRQGEMWLWELKPSPSLFGPAKTAGFESFDGRTRYRAVYDLDDPTRLKAIETPAPANGVDRGKEMAHGIIDRVLGASIPGCPDPLEELLEKARGVRPERELIGDIETWKVDFGQLKFRNGTTGIVQAWFDPAAGFLPRRIISHMTVPRRGEDSMFVERTASLRVADFVAVDGSGEQPKIWFPREAKHGSGFGTSRVIVDSIQRTGALRPADFGPPRPRAL